MTTNPHDMPPGFLWTGGIGFGSAYRARRLRLYRLLTPEERLVRDARRGGFPLLRKEACGPAPGKTIHGVLERFTTPTTNAARVNHD